MLFSPKKDSKFYFISRSILLKAEKQKSQNCANRLYTMSELYRAKRIDVPKKKKKTKNINKEGFQKTKKKVSDDENF